MLNLKVKIFRVTILSIVSMAILGGCWKDPLLDIKQAPLISDKSDTEISSMPTPPVVENGILIFSSEDQYDSYVDYLSSITTCLETDSCLADVDDVLQVEEEALGFLSYRQVYHDLTDVEFNSLSDVPEPKFVDPVLQSVLSPQFDIAIGDEYYNLAVEGFEVLLHTTDFDKITAARDYIAAGNDVVEIENILVDNGVLEYGDADVNRPSYKKAQSNYSNQNDRMKLFVKNVFQGEGCEAGEVCLYKVGMYGFGANPNINPSFQGTFVIDWGDGSPIQTFTNAGAFSPYNKLSTCHPYNAGTYTITITGTPNNTAYGSLTLTIPLTVQNTACGYGVSKSVSQWKYPTSDRAMKCELQARNLSISRKVIAQTTAYKKKSNGKWKSYKADRVVVQLGGAVTDAACGNPQNVVGASWPYNSKKAKADDVIGYMYGYYSITSNHKILINGTYYNHDLELIGCE